MVNGSTIPARCAPWMVRSEPTGCGTSSIGLHCWRKELHVET
ncbi:hypothetical protein GQ600_496 [Phytophthora cactorum]|nr:hypothetical protein GQ600_496 [Phytophthora cactorum]